MKRLKHTYIFAVVYRWLWFILLSRIPLTRNGLGKLWLWLVGVLQDYLTTFGPDTYAKVAAIAAKVWSFLFVPSLLILLLVSLVKAAKKRLKKKGNSSSNLFQRIEAVIRKYFPTRDRGVSPSIAPPETYYFVRFLYLDDSESYHERLFEVTRLLDKPIEINCGSCRFTLRLNGFSGFRRSTPRILLEAVNASGKPLLETDCVVLPSGGVCRHDDWSFELLPAAI